MLCASHSVCWVHHQRKFQLDLPPYLRDFRATCSKSVTQASLPGDNRALEPPDSIPNSEVKRRIADGSVGFPHVRVGHCQAFIKKWLSKRAALFFASNLSFSNAYLARRSCGNRWIYSDMPYNLKAYMFDGWFVAISRQIIQTSFNEAL